MIQIEPDVLAIGKDFGVTARLVQFAQAVIEAEGGGNHIIRAVQLSIPAIQTRDEAIRVLYRSIVHRLCDYGIAADEGLDDFIDYFGGFWAPLHVLNDPTNLNRNWIPNVRKLLDVSNA